MKTFLAIDFGTTQSSIAVITENSTREPQVIEINDGQRAVKAVATAIQLDITGNIAYFGAKALAKSEDAPERTFQNFKVFVGSKDPTYSQLTGQDKYTPDTLALMYLTHLRKQIEEHYFNGTKLAAMPELSCVIGCPSDWDEVRKNTLKENAQTAGFPKVTICDEPIGVIYYSHYYGGLKFQKSQNILVYDFGGGTADVAIARIDISDSGEIKPSVLAVGGLPNLGGSNFDAAISAHYMRQNNYDLSPLPVKSKLHDSWVIGLAARDVKEELSRKEAIEKTINRLKVTEGAKPQKLSLNRSEFVSVCGDLIGNFDEPVYDAMTSAGLSADDINVVILAGGSSAMPFVKEKMSEIFPTEKIVLSPSPEIIAQGLATYGKSMASGGKVIESAESALQAKDNTHNFSTNFSTENSKSMDVPSGAEAQPEQKSRFWKFVAVAVLVAILGLGVSSYITYRVNEERARQQTQKNDKDHSAEGAALGAVIGSMFGPWGTVLGGIIGGVLGSGGEDKQSSEQSSEGCGGCETSHVLLALLTAGAIGFGAWHFYSGSRRPKTKQNLTDGQSK